VIQNNASRLSAIVFTAVVINILLFSAIQYMVGNQRIRLADSTQFDLANFIRMAEQPRDVSSRRNPKAPKKPDTEAQRDVERLAKASKMGGIGGLSVDMPDINIEIDVGGGIQIARELTPLVRFPPNYPLSAVTNRIEGYVLLRFTVTETGSVANPEVLQSEPPKIFDRAARRAVLRWKYQPQLIDGEPVAVVTYTRILFELLEE
jgi:protein TonB